MLSHLSLTLNTIMTNPNSHLPQGVQFDLNEAKQLFMNEERVEDVDPQFNRVVEGLEEALKQHDEEFSVDGNRYLFDQSAFVNALEHVVADQLSAVKKEKLNWQEAAARINRWLVFCEAVVNMGITCLYSREALEKEDYTTVFNTLKLNKTFETTFLKPRGIRVEFRHKNAMVKEKYPWLAMPCLIVKDDEGQEHEIALTPGPEARVWWLDILTNFHASYNWDFQDLSGDGAAASSIHDPYATLDDDEDDEDEDGFTVNPDFVAEQNQPKVVMNPVSEQGFVHKEIAPHPGLFTTTESLGESSFNKPEGFFSKVKGFFRKLFRS